MRLIRASLCRGCRHTERNSKHVSWRCLHSAELCLLCTQLKKLLNQLPAAGPDRTEAEQDFFRQLRAEVRAVNQCAPPAPLRRLQSHVRCELVFSQRWW